MNGIVLIDKPADWTSHDVVAKARRIMQTRRIGHTGTLDPFATGLLMLCIGRVTRVAQFLSAEEKEYQAVMRLGFATDTGDLTGSPLAPEVDASHITRDAVESVMTDFRGRLTQIPPMYAAKKVKGVRLYELARRGVVVEREPIGIEIKELELDAADVSSSGDIAFRTVCSSGTYVRVLAEDIGNRLGVGAHLIALRRTRIGKCRLADARGLDELEVLAEADRLNEALLAPATVLRMRVVQLAEGERGRVISGQGIASGEAAVEGERAMLLTPEGELVAVAEFVESRSQWQPRVVIAVD